MNLKSKSLILIYFIFFGFFVSLSSAFASTVTKTLYAWVKDQAGNVSISKSANVDITLPTAPTNTYYISPSGSDTTGNGSTTTPWASLYKACNSVTTQGSTIHVKAGTYTETLSCNLAVGVSIEGEGQTNTIIKSHYKTPNTSGMSSASIYLVSNTTGSTDGNQSISNLKLDGDALQGSAGILISKRSNVKVHDVTIVDFFKNGIAFRGPSTYQINPPYAYDNGNEFYNSTITNCGDIPGDNVTWSGGALIYIASQSDMLIHDNILTENSRAQGHNGNIMNAGGRHFKNVKYYNNKSYKPDDEGPQMNASGAPKSLPTGWNFHLEFWDMEGGVEIYNNEFHGGDIPIDVGGSHSYKGSYSYSVSIHDNLFTPISSSVRTSYYGKNAIVLESLIELSDVLIYNNTFEYGYYGVSIYPQYSRNILIYDNVFNNAIYPLNLHSTTDVYSNLTTVSFYRNLINCKYDSSYSYGALRIRASETSNVSDINIYNNTFVTDNLIHMAAIELKVGQTSGNTQISGGTMSNINIKNNIMAYFTNQGAVKITNNGVLNGLHIENNLTYNLNNVNAMPYFGPLNIGTMTNYTYLNNIPTSNTTQQNPLFVSSTDFHLQPTSPAINTGTNVGLPYNGTAPDIGAYESN